MLDSMTLDFFPALGKIEPNSNMPELGSYDYV